MASLSPDGPHRSGTERAAVVALANIDPVQNDAALTLCRALKSIGLPFVLIWAMAEDESRYPPIGFDTVDIIRVNQMQHPWPTIPDDPGLRLADQIGPILSDFAVVYFFPRDGLATYAIRQKRLSGASSPVFVAIADQTPARPSLVPAAHSRAWFARRLAESYQVRHADLLLCIDPIRPEDLRASALSLPSDVLSMPADMRFSAGARELVETKINRAMQQTKADATPVTIPVVTVCVPHFNHGQYLPQLLASLECQTSRDFTVIVVDDGSTSAASQRIFVQMEQSYRSQGWRFIQQSHAGAATARTRAASEAQTEYLMFLDADDVAHPLLLERLIEAATRSGNDLLSVWSHGFSGEELPIDLPYGSLRRAPLDLRAPVGFDLVADLHPSTPISSVCFLRRNAFNEVGGFPKSVVASESLHGLEARIVLARYRTDVIPEALHFKRLDAEKPSSSAVIWDQEALRSAYQEYLNAIHLPSFALAYQAIEAHRNDIEAKVSNLQHNLGHRFSNKGPRDRLRLLLLTSSWPYPPMTGCLLRWWAMIKYLGTRHDLTLVTYANSRDADYQHEILRYCRSIYAVGYGGPQPLADAALPYLVRSRMSTRMREAVRAVPTHLYDAALIEQIFLAPYREDIEAPMILGEHNIESRLLAQAADQDPLGGLTPGFENPKVEADLLRDYENRTWPEFALRSAVNELERSEIQRRAKNGRTILVENGTDPDIWLADAKPNTGNILFLGMLGYFPNVDGVLRFSRDIWPEISRLNPSCQFIIAGSAPTEDVRALSTQRGFRLVENPPDIRPIACQASVAIVPLWIGSGTRIKILTSMALGLPTVSTSLGCEGLAVEDGEHILVRDDPIEFALAVDELLNNPDLWAKLRANGRKLVRDRYAWNQTLGSLEAALWTLAG